MNYFGKPVATTNRAKKKVYSYDRHHGIFRPLLDGVAAAVQRILKAVNLTPIEIGLFYKDRFHVIAVFHLTSKLLANTADIFSEGVCRQASLLPHTPSHRFQYTVRDVPILCPLFARRIVVGILWQILFDLPIILIPEVILVTRSVGMAPTV